MPELPEVETVAKQLNEVLLGRRITKVKVYREKSAQSALEELEGKTIKSVGRRAKMIVMELMEKEMVLLVHLKMTGQLIWVPEAKEESFGVETKSSPDDGHLEIRIEDKSKQRIYGGHPTPDWIQELPSKHTRIELEFEEGSRLYFNDMRVFGWVKVESKEQFEKRLAKFPPDVVDVEFTGSYLKKVLGRSKRAVKLVLLDQDKMGGLGNIYVNDALWKARIDPFRAADSLTKEEVRDLHQAIREVIERGIELGGASESTYKHIDGLGGSYQTEFLVYKQDKTKCKREGCEGVIEKVKLGGRGTYFCPVCQKGG